MASINLVGQWLGNFQVLEELGRGGMGIVYRAYQPSLSRYVALKVLPPHLAFDEQLVERFLREARAAASLNHPNIVTIYDVGQHEGTHYIVMELLEGQTLRELIEREGALPPQRATRIVGQVAVALDYAHQRGFVHRDVKPGNIFIGPGDRVTLTDFGIAKAGWGTRLTQTGVLIGTPEYMSPEQAQGHAADARSDVYALAVVAYQMLSGQVPFGGTTPHAVLYKQVHEAPPPLGSLRPGLPSALEGVLRRGLAKDPAARYASAGAFAQALAAAAVAPIRGTATASGPTVVASPDDDGQRGLPVWIWALAAITAVVVIGSLALTYFVVVRPKPEGGTEQAAAGQQTRTAKALTAEALATTTIPDSTVTLAASHTASPATPTAAALETAEQTASPSATPPVAATPSPGVTTGVPATSTPPVATTIAPPTDTPLPPPTDTALPPTSTPAPTNTPTDTPVPPTPACSLAPDPQLAGQWDRDRIGCPTGPANVIWAAWEPFQGAYLMWRSDTDNVYVMHFASNSSPWQGDWFETPDEWKWDGSNPDGVGLVPPPGLYEPVRGFGYIWRSFLGGASGRLGWATGEEKGFCTNIQPFEQGVMFHSSTVEFCQDQLFNWARDPSFTPLYFSLNGDGTWLRH